MQLRGLLCAVALLGSAAHADDAPAGGWSNVPPTTNAAFGPGTAWLALASGSRASVRWKAPSGMPVTGLVVHVWAQTPGKTNLVGETALAADVAEIAIDGPAYPRSYRCDIEGLDAARTAWRFSVTWPQPSPCLTSAQLFPAIPLQGVPDGLRADWHSDTFTVRTQSGWDWFYVSSSVDTYEGWRTRGLSLWIDCGGRETKLCGASHDMPLLLDIPPSAIPDGEHNVRFILRHDGKGRLGLSAPLYLLVWSATVTMEPAE